MSDAPGGMDEATLAGIEQRAQAATEGPWQLDYESDWDDFGTRFDYVHHLVGPRTPYTQYPESPNATKITEIAELSNADAEFIAAARTDVPALAAEVRRLSAALADATDVYTLRERGLRVLGDEQCCELACDGGACESCPCCCAGWCVAGHNAEIPDPVNDAENYAIWLEIAAEHNPVAKRLTDVSAALAEQQRRAEHIAWERDSSDDAVGVSVGLINDLTARAEAAEAALADLRAQLRPPACEKCDDADPERPLCADCMRWVREESYAGIRAERDELRAAFARIEAMREQIESALFFKFDDNTFQKFAAALAAAPSDLGREAPPSSSGEQR